MKPIYLLPGQWAVALDATEITTILGSCVAVCLFDRVRRVGGMNHFLLPSGGEGFHDRSRYGDTACEDLLQCFLASGTKPRDLDARLVGGARVGGIGAPDVVSLGDRNADIARRVLTSHGVGVSGEDLGGTAARRLKFHSGEGRLEVRTIDVTAVAPAPLPLDLQHLPGSAGPGPRASQR